MFCLACFLRYLACQPHFGRPSARRRLRSLHVIRLAFHGLPPLLMPWRIAAIYEKLSSNSGAVPPESDQNDPRQHPRRSPLANQRTPPSTAIHLSAIMLLPIPETYLVSIWKLII